MSKYRVFSILWIDVRADDAETAKTMAGQIYYDLPPQEQESLAGFVVAHRFDDHANGTVDITVPIVSEWQDN